MNNNLIIYFSFLFVFNFSAQAQVKDNLKNDIKNLFEVGGEVYTAPLNFDKNDWINFSATIGATVGAYFLDDEVRKFAQENRTKFLDEIAVYDDYYLYLGTASFAATYLYGLIGKNDYMRELGLQIGEAMLYAGVTTLAIKISLGRSRPFRNEGNSEFDVFQFDDSKYSFSSGHSSLAFAFSTVAAEQIDNFFWKAAWMTAAALVASGRIYQDVHWFSDVVMGASIGYFIGRLVVSYHKKEQQLPNEVIPPPIINFTITL